MSRDREAGGTPPGTSLPEIPAQLLLPLALLAAAVLAAFLAGQAELPGWLTALALLLAFAGALVSGAYWSRQRQLDRLRDARLQHQLLGQLLDCWQWQTDATHRLTRLQPPQAAPASAWVEGAFSGEPLWDRFDDAERSLRARLEAHAPVADLRVLQAAEPGSARSWRLRGLPRFDGRGRFQGYLGVAEPMAAHDDAAAARLGLQHLLAQGPGLFLALELGDSGWQLRQASPAARALLALPEPSDGDPQSALAEALPWPQALQQLPDGLRTALSQPHPRGQVQAEGWRGRWLPLTSDDRSPTSSPSQAQRLLLHLAPPGGVQDSTLQAMAEEHASFSYTISHDLRAPIRVVEGFGRILKEDYGAQLDRVGRDHLDRIVSAAARMNLMIDALLSLSQLSTQPLARQPVNLSQMAGYVVDDLRRQAPDRNVVVHIAPALATTGDPTLLRMALENLLGNAWKYSAKNPQAELRFELATAQGRSAFCVSDNGAGFDMRFADRLFGVFQRLHSASDFQGTGVGLASVRRIVRRHGGEVWAESEVGHGARFYFTLKG